MQFYIRCQDANGNENVDEFSISFCVDKGPDTTPPIIESSSITTGSPVSYNIDAVPIELYVNEPVDCKWSRLDKPYDEMETQMTCPNDLRSITPIGQYTCRSNLTAIKNQESNDFYFKCRDQPEASANSRNTNVQSYKVTLRGTQPLNILNVGPNETIMASTTTAKVTLSAVTDDGADEGKALCLFSPTGTAGSYIAMFNSNSHEHSQELDLTEGSYTYYFRCVDDGGNSATSNTSFNVFIDKQMPRVTRAYKEGVDALKIVTDEDAECRYSLSDCNFVFAEGTAMLLVNPSVKTQHYAKWDATSTYRIKCKDVYGNEPTPNACSAIIRPTQFEKK